MIDVLTFGETLVSITASDIGPLMVGARMQLSIAGAESNVAIGLARLGHRVRWTGCVGNDEFGEIILRTLRAEGIDTTLARTVPDAPTALMIKQQPIGQLSKVTYFRTNSAGTRIDPDLTGSALAEHPKILHVTGITPALSESALEAVTAAMTAATANGAHVSLDVNYRSALWPADKASKTLRPLAELSDTIFGSTGEIELITGKDADVASMTANGRVIVVKEGDDGATVLTDGGQFKRGAFEVPTVDTVGAGDAFVAGYLSAQLDGLDIKERLERACATGAFSVATHGDWEGLPTRRNLPLLNRGLNVTIR